LINFDLLIKFRELEVTGRITDTMRITQKKHVWFKTTVSSPSSNTTEPRAVLKSQSDKFEIADRSV
jgi:hypothetical protein